MTAKLTAWECRAPTATKPGVLRLTIEIDEDAAEDFLGDLDARRPGSGVADATATKALLTDLHWHLINKG